jgi:hypothetical protein
MDDASRAPPLRFVHGTKWPWRRLLCDSIESEKKVREPWINFRVEPELDHPYGRIIIFFRIFLFL